MYLMELTQQDVMVTACSRCHCREAYTTTGYTPFLSFEVADLQDSLQKLLQHGAVMDGPIKYADQGKVRRAGICFMFIIACMLSWQQPNADHVARWQ